MNLGFVLLIIIAAGIFGRKRPISGALLGVAVTLAIVLCLQDYNIKSIIVSALKGIPASFVAAYFAYFLRSGLEGGDHNKGPSFLGGGRGGGGAGGIILSDEEREKHKKSAGQHCKFRFIRTMDV